MGDKIESGDAIVGRIVQKSFEGFGVFVGKVISYNSARGFYKIKYEDGDAEELEIEEVEGILLTDGEADGELIARKRKLDDLTSGEAAAWKPKRRRGRPRKQKKVGIDAKEEGKSDGSFDLGQTLEQPNSADLDKTRKPGSERDDGDQGLSSAEPKRKRKRQTHVCNSSSPTIKWELRTRKKPCSVVSPETAPTRTPRNGRKPTVYKCTTNSGSESEGGDVSSSDESYIASYQDAAPSASEDSESKGAGRCKALEALEGNNDALDGPLPPMQPLPPSSNDLAVPEQSIADLFSVYSCLRSFSTSLFLSPFGLEDFVGALNCKSASSLLDCVHVSLLHALRRHLEFLSAEGFAPATDCLRHLNWDFMDAVTWPVYLVEYLITQGFSKKSGHKVGRLKLLDGEYCRTPVSIKLTVLQFLCDDVMEAEEIRAEINTRVSSQADIDADLRVNSCFGGSVSFERKSRNSKRKNPKRLGKKSKKADFTTKADEQGSSVSSQVTIEKLSSVRYTTILQDNPGHLQIDVGEKSRTTVNGVKDWNGDECCLCGMDGSLICCDGCPAAYHSRCVGVSKAHLPEGDWYCPECVVSNGTKGLQALKGLQGAETLGIDPYGRVYVATCGYLLVSEFAFHPDATHKYYNRNDAIKVMEILGLSGSLYDGIQNAISKYWNIPKGGNGLKDNVSTMGPLHLTKADISYEKCPLELSDMSVCQSFVQQEEENVSALPCLISQEDKIIKKIPFSQESEGVQNSGPSKHKDHEMVDMDRSNDNITQLTSSEGSVEITSLHMNGQGCLKFSVQQPTDFAADRTATCSVDLVKYNSVQEQQLFEVDADSAAVQVQLTDAGSLQGQQQTRIGANKRAARVDLVNNNPNREAGLKPNAYVNQYVLGDMAASAAANLTVKAAEENKGTKRHGASKKSPSTTISEQVKAFAKAAMQFCWPNLSKKLMELPKERCGWCFLCKSSVGNHRGCLLNVAARNKMAGATRVLGGLRPTKNGDGHLPSVAAYMLYIEDQLHGLMDGPWKNPYYRKHWRKRVEQASTVAEVKYSILELELNIRRVALSAGWFKPIDDSSAVVPTVQIGSSIAGLTTKQSGSVKRGRKRTAFAETIAASKDAGLFIVDWWRGGRLTGQVYYRKLLPRTVARQAGRQAGSRRIPGIFYDEGSEIPRRSRQYAWRAAVEMAGSVSDLALQVRSLDACIVWGELVNSEDCSQSDRTVGKGAADFKNVTINAKSFEGGVVKYLLDFGKQKAIPTHITKHGDRLGEAPDCRNKYWLSESHLPLYILKEYEERLPLNGHLSKGLKRFCKDKRRLLKTSRKEIFSSLLMKAESCEKCTCSQCNTDVLIRKAVRCQICQGSFHDKCTVASCFLDNMECKYTCYKCHSVMFPESKSKKLKTRLGKRSVLISEGCRLAEKQVQENCKSLSVPKVKGGKRSHLPLHDEHVARKNYGGTDKYALQRKKSGGISHSDGLLWKKTRGDELGEHFREKKILFPCLNKTVASVSPKCFLCCEAYNPKLIYIGCEYCKEWYHGDAFGLNMENIVDLVGFKCHKCRKRSTPMCPHARGDKLRVKRLRGKGKTDEVEVMDVTDNGKPLDVIYSRSRRVSDEELQAMLAGEEHAPIEIKFQTTSDDAPLNPMVENNGQVSAAGKIVNSACSSADAQSLSPKINRDTCITDYLNDEIVCCQQDQTHDEMREKSIGSEMMNTEAIQAYSGIVSRNTLSFTELLASEDDRVEDLVDLSQGIAEKWSDSLQSADKGVNMFSQLQGIEGSHQHSSGATISADDSKNIDCRLENGFLVGNLLNQPCGAGTMVRAEEMKAICAACSLREVPPDIQCSGCGIAIHCHCCEWALTGTWTVCGWKCNDCQVGFVQAQGTFPG